MPDRSLNLRELLVVGLCAAAFLSTRLVLRLPVHLPGHNAGIFTFFLIVAAGAVGRAPAGTLMAAVSGMLAMVAGIGSDDGPAVVARYVLPGLALDALLVVGVDATGRVGVAASVGAAAALLKLSVSLGWAALIGQPADWLAARMVVGGPIHAVSGAVGGLLAGLLVRRLRRAGLVG